MVYFDNAATTFPKPASVVAAARAAVVKYGANPGRAAHKFSINTSEAVFNARDKCAEFFSAETANTVFTLNCTHALNIAIKGMAVPGSHFIISDLEHNASSRPVHAASKESGITYSIAKTAQTAEETLKAFENLINIKTKAVVCTAASNVTGKIMPYREIAALCRERGICFILDAAQGAGVIPIGLGGGVNIICCPGHKGLYGTMGTGLMVTDGKYPLKTFTEGGTGSNSRDLEQPENLPDRFECGTLNTPGIIALGAGIDFLRKKGIDNIREYERGLCDILLDGIAENDRVVVYFERFDQTRLPLVPFNIKGMSSAKAAALLSDAGFCLRGGLHCACLAHKKMNTLDTGAVRFTPSTFNKKSEVRALVREINRIAKL